MAISKKYDALSASFMFLSFITAALLVSVQSRGMFNSAPLATAGLQAPPAASPTVSLLLKTPETTPSLAAASSQASTLQSGMAEILSPALHPVVLMQQPRLVVDLSDRQVSLYQADKLQSRFNIAIGREGWETPTGEFNILTMQEHPVWQNPITGETVTQGADNPLGSRWIGFWTDGTHQIGFHGTNQDYLIGQAVSHGCIRMRDPDIQALYTQVAVGTPVVVVP